jgi:hypothetical protein
MGKSLLETFRSLDNSKKDVLADTDSPLLLSFAALSIARSICECERLSAEHIVACLEAAGVAVKKQSVSKALARASGRVSAVKGIDGEALYSLMTTGERQIAQLLGGGELSVIRIDGTTPRTARRRLGEVLSGLEGIVRVCDPYYGVRTLDSLDNFPESTSVRFLTARTNESERKLAGALRDFRKERPKIEFRIASSHDLHDRYVLAKDTLLILGHGLKDIGGKESFMICLGSALVSDLMKQISDAFDTRWKSASKMIDDAG